MDYRHLGDALNGLNKAVDHLIKHVVFLAGCLVLTVVVLVAVVVAWLVWR